MPSEERCKLHILGGAGVGHSLALNGYRASGGPSIYAALGRTIGSLDG